MYDFFSIVNWWAVIVCAVASMVIGFVWYGPLFSKKWGELTGWTAEKTASVKGASMARSYIMAFIAAFLVATVLALVLRATGIDNVGGGLATAALAWLGFTGATIGVNMIFERRPVSLFFIESGYHLVAILVYAVILTLWL